MFDPKPHLIQLPRKVKNKATGHWDTIFEEYLEVKWRLVMFREKYPHGRITTEEIQVDLERQYARFRCVVEDGEGGQATGYGTETAADFADYVERAETRAIGRALALLGFGTQFVGQDLTEGEHVADAPVASTNGQAHDAREADVPTFDPPAPNGDTPTPTTIPREDGLPCGGQVIADLKPAPLSMLISKTAHLAAEQGGRWIVLLAALQSERASRMAKGQRPPVEVAREPGQEG